MQADAAEGNATARALAVLAFTLNTTERLAGEIRRTEESTDDYRHEVSFGGRLSC